ncbi:MAG TPA: aminotransferase class I/II-fold pyridoxal phosphate-dependent enzyme [Actinomycetota bacterium]|nr:aminotransferase class I/II-fold pyridoxal phosphate-dependent enzyme [Actinomycetota bacterium]
MNTDRVSPFVRDQLGASALMDFVVGSRWAERRGAAGISDFVFGNPHELALPDFHEAVRKWSVPQDPSWYAYKMSEPVAQQTVAATLRKRTGMEFMPEDVAMTNGAFGALAVVLRAIAGAGDDVVFFTPPWFSYESLIKVTGAGAVRVSLQPPAFDLDTDVLAKSITERTRAVIVNTPHNPTGRIYSAETLSSVAHVLREASQKWGRPVYLISDEAYNRIVYDDAEFHSPVEFYNEAFLVYTYGKTLLTPGERLGYIALPPTMPERELMRAAILMSQISTGWAFPNAILQHALPDIEPLSIDIKALQERRDIMFEGLTGMGYELRRPEGTFYLLVRSPIEDDQSFVNLLAEKDVFVMPGTMVELPGWFRISLTASKDMVTRSLPIFESALNEAKVPA